MPRPVVPMRVAASSASRKAVEFAMQWQDQRRILGDAQSFGSRPRPWLLQLVDFLDQRLGVDHDAIADDRQLARPRTTPDGSSDSL